MMLFIALVRIALVHQKSYISNKPIKFSLVPYMFVEGSLIDSVLGECWGPG